MVLAFTGKVRTVPDEILFKKFIKYLLIRDDKNPDFKSFW